MQAIGGYNEFELKTEGEHYHKNALRLNTARNCFEYILRVRRYKKVYIPYYTCEVMLEPLMKLLIPYEFYHINENFELTEIIHLNNNEAVLYTNYFGLKQQYIEKLADYYGEHLIIDNSQAFFDYPVNSIDTFYSARKFFGVPDGAYLYTGTYLDEELEQDYSYDRMSHLLKRIDVSAEFGYNDFQETECKLSHQPIKKMSLLTERILINIDYESIKLERRKNYLYLLNNLSSSKKWDLNFNAIPLSYPFFCKKNSLRKELISYKIYIPQYWKNVDKWLNNTYTFEHLFSNYLLPLPIYKIKEISTIVEIINNKLS